MSNNAKWFQWFAYAALLSALIQAFVEPTSTRNILLFSAVMTVVTGVLVWLAGRGRMWAALIFIILAAMMVLTCIGDFWPSAPAWMTASPSTTTTAKLLGVANAAFAVIAVYFFAASRREAR